MMDWVKKIWNDGRNLLEPIMSMFKVNVEWARYLIDLRLGFTRNDVWHLGQLAVWTPVTQNFWNGIFTFNIYFVKTTLRKIPVLLPRMGMVIRFSRNYWFQAGAGYLFDRGEPAFKCVIQNWKNEEKYNPGCNAKHWEEGPV